MVDIFLFIISGLLLMNYDDFYDNSKGEYWSLARINPKRKNNLYLLECLDSFKQNRSTIHWSKCIRKDKENKEIRHVTRGINNIRLSRLFKGFSSLTFVQLNRQSPAIGNFSYRQRYAAEKKRKYRHIY